MLRYASRIPRRSPPTRKVRPQLQRILADDFLAAVFPDQAACLENVAGRREIPDHRSAHFSSLMVSDERRAHELAVIPRL